VLLQSVIRLNYESQERESKKVAHPSNDAATLRGLVWNVSIFKLSWWHFFKERLLLQLKASVNMREKFSLSGMKV